MSAHAVGDVVRIKAFASREEADDYTAEHGHLSSGYFLELLQYTGDDYPYAVIDSGESTISLRPLFEGSGLGVVCLWQCCVYKPDVKEIRQECKCDLQLGCTCGVFEAEMVEKGFFKNPYTRMWEERV